LSRTFQKRGAIMPEQTPSTQAPSTPKRKRCGQLKKFYHFLNLDKPIPDVFILHARNCRICLLHLTYTLAVGEACNTTNRFFKKSCPDRKALTYRLLVVVRGLIRLLLFHPELTREAARGLQILTPEEQLFIVQLSFHLDECEFCSDYCNILYANMLAAQERYENAVRKGESVRPVIKDSAEEIDIIDRNLIMPSPMRRGQKPKPN